MTEQIASVIAAIFSAIATALAAYAAWIGPVHAAKLAEELRRKTSVEEEKRRLKLDVFTSLMMHRKVFWVEAAVRHLNLIDVVFHDSRTVRDAWANLFVTLERNTNIPQQMQNEIQNEKFFKLLDEMAADLGLSKSLLPDDLRRVYYPKSLSEVELVATLEREQKLHNFTGRGGPAANSAPISSSNGYWPPRP
jgi:hypothetical protein